jgi:hypothetical protein
MRNLSFLQLQLVLGLGTIVALIVLLEGGARLAVLYRYGRHDTGFHHIFKYEPFLVAQSNERFLMPYAPKSDRFRILILGGSTANGLADVSREFYSKIFAKLTTKPVEVINFAQPGFISSQELIMLARYGFRVEPDLVIVLDGVNDIRTMTKGRSPGIPYTNAWVETAVNRPFLNALLAIGRHSQFLNVLRKLEERREERAMQLDARALDFAIAEYLTNHSAMEAMARGLGAKFVTALQPYIHLRRVNTANELALPVMTNYAYRREWLTEAMRRLRTELWRHARGANAAFIDSTSAFDNSTDDCFVNEVHLTGQGEKLLLIHIANELASANSK